MIVVEKSGYTKAQDLTTLEKDAYDTMYEKGGLMIGTEDGGSFSCPARLCVMPHR